MSRNPLADHCTYVVNGVPCGRPMHLSHQQQNTDGTTLAWNLCDGHLAQERAKQAQLPAAPGAKSVDNAMFSRLIAEHAILGAHVIRIPRRP
jgi:hypothetical protein